jgi:hypothetical protein
LTPYVGGPIQIVWWYQGVSIGDPLYGWLVDDVGITGTAAGQGGNIVISNNLSQASFDLSGPINVHGVGAQVITNAPTGIYSISFSDVAFYQTPLSQSATLRTAGSTLTFNANYSFIDANHNGISDAWEKYYFGAVTTNRTQLTDSDGDGMSDYAEFIAGTDPTNAASKFTFLGAGVQNNGSFKFQWSAVPGRTYQVETSTNLTDWVPASGWLQATGSPMSFTTTNLGTGALMYRIQVRP